jgi:catechol 2,3-dioxygenase-like lactoylglutathione lyase family enzyme
MVKLDHLMIPVSDWRASRDWYVRHFGFSIEFEDASGGPSGLGVAALQDDAGLSVFLEQKAEPILSGQSAYTLQVDDVEKTCGRLKDAGGTLVLPPSKQFWGYGAVAADPDGHLLHVYDDASMAEKG